MGQFTEEGLASVAADQAGTKGARSGRTKDGGPDGRWATRAIARGGLRNGRVWAEKRERSV